MKINWKLRLQNKVTLTTLIITVIGIVYTVLGMFGVVPAVSQEQIVNVCLMVVELFVILGIVVDPTTKGFDDTKQALNYDEPRDETK